MTDSCFVRSKNELHVSYMEVGAQNAHFAGAKCDRQQTICS